MPGSRSRAASKAAANAPKAWFLGMDGGGHPYDASPMLKGDKVGQTESWKMWLTLQVPELWDEQGDVFVYLHPQSENRGPSFRIPTRAIADSDNLMTLAFGSASGLRATRSFDGRGSSKDASRTLNTYGELSPLSPPLTLSDGSDSMRSFAPREGHLYFPSRTAQPKEDRAAEDEEYYVSVRNVFAFLTKQTLVATKRHPTTFSVFILISGHLSRQGFLSLDGATFGDVATTSFNFYTEAFQLADVRRSREKTMEGIILGECMRSMELYNESFAHGVGKYDEIIALKSTLFGMISPASRSRIERAWIDLGQRKQAVSLRLETFEFPALFSGVAASTSSDESKLVRFKAWKSHFLTMRRQVLGYYKDLYGAWPPRASSKKNNLTYDGLNRLVLRNLYLDLCTLYDLLVDRSSLTSRSTGASITTHTPVQEALRKLLHESDHSSPPVQPPTPFDVPLLPSISTLEPNLDMLPQKQQNAASTRKLKDYEIKLILARSHNLDSQLNTPFLRTYMDFEQREAKGKNASELAELRIGCWLFVYVVIQSLPMLVVDAPNLKYTQGVETFLCQPPKGLAPWMDESTQVKRNWYGVNGGAGMVSLPSDVVEYGVEGIYRASHCWTVADQWMKGLEFHDPEVEEYALSPTTPGENQGYSDLEWNARPREPSRSRDCLTADFAHMSFSQPDMYETQHEIYSQPGQHEMHSSSRHASDIFPRAYTPPQQYQYQPPYIGMPGGTTPPSRPMHQSTTMPDLRIYTTSQPPHRYASPPEQSRSQASNDWQHRHRSGTVEGYGRVARSTEPVKEVKGFDDILADMQREKNGAKKEKEKDKVDSGNQERRKSWLGF